MDYYKIEYYLQAKTEEEPSLQYDYIIRTNRAIQSVKGYISKREKFFSEYSTNWKTMEDGEEFEIWHRSIKPSVIKSFQKEYNSDTIERFILVKKPLTREANDKLKDEAGNNCQNAFTKY